LKSLEKTRNIEQDGALALTIDLTTWRRMGGDFATGDELGRISELSEAHRWRDQLLCQGHPSG
jgi:hypothetical protein